MPAEDKPCRRRVTPFGVRSRHRRGRQRSAREPLRRGSRQKKLRALSFLLATPSGFAALTPITPVRFGDASEASEQLPRATPTVDETPPAILETKPALPGEAAAAPGAPEAFSAAEAKPGKQSEILQKKKCVAVKTALSRTGQGGRAVHGGKRDPADPLAVVGRAVNSFTARIAEDLRRIPVRLSSLMAGH